MGLVTSKVQEALTLVLSSLGIWMLFTDRPERLRVISDAPPPADTSTDPMPMAWDGDLSEEALSLRMKELQSWLEGDLLLEPEILAPQNREALVKAQLEHRWSALQATHNTHRKRTIVFGFPKRRCTTSLQELERSIVSDSNDTKCMFSLLVVVSLSDMSLRKHHAVRICCICWL